MDCHEGSRIRHQGAAADIAGCLSALKEIVGEKWILTADEDSAPYLVDWRGMFRGQAIAVVRPKSTDQVSAIVRTCRQYDIPVVPQGGNTGLVGGATPSPEGDAVLLHMGRMNQIRSIDPANHTMVVEAGCILTTAQDAAVQAGRMFPMSFGAEGSCQIGGAIATNAGGMRALRYGSMRDLVLGLEVVLADGTVWNGLKRVRKNNTGYDLKQLFIGSEGTLGIVTAAVLKLFPMPKERVTTLIAVRDPQAAVDLLVSARQATGDDVDACELIPTCGVKLALKHVIGARDPMEEACDHYLLLEIVTARNDAQLGATVEGLLAEAFEDGRVSNAVIAATEAQAQEIWHLREAIVEGQRLEGPHLKLDVSVPLSDIPAFLVKAEAAVLEVDPACRIIAFGHVGDGNIHFNVFPPDGLDEDRTAEVSSRIKLAVYDAVQAFDGSISAEHGVGQLKREDVVRYRSPIETRLMALIKDALDPSHLMNPGKVIQRPDAP
jgi:FAD/FMN-containing dehydrogenase